MQGLLYICAVISLQCATAYQKFSTCDDGVVFVPNPRNCYQFLKCDTGEIYSCSDGLHYDEKIGRCVIPDAAKCSRESEDTEPQPVQDPEQPPDPEFELDLELTTESVIETTSASNPELEPDLELTTESVIETTSASDPELEPDLELTTESVIETTPASDPDPLPETETESESELDTEPEPEAKPTSCPEENSSTHGVYLPHETNCSVYYQCDWGVPIARECPAGLYFNPKEDACDWPRNVDCQNA